MLRPMLCFKYKFTDSVEALFKGRV